MSLVDVSSVDAPAPSPTAVTAAPAASSARYRWTEVEADFWVAHSAGEFAGSIDRTTVGYVGRDRFGEPVGMFASFAAAKKALAATRSPRPHPRRSTPAPFVAATLTGTLSVGIAIVAATSVVLPL